MATLISDTFALEAAGVCKRFGKVEALRDVQLHWKGSANQRVIDVKQSLAAGRVVLWS